MRGEREIAIAQIAIAQDVRDFYKKAKPEKARSDQRSDLVIFKKSDVNSSINIIKIFNVLIRSAS